MEPTTAAKNQPNTQLLLLGALVLGIAFIAGVLFLISLAELTNRETTLLGTVLTLLSIGIGWGISHYYATRDKKAAIDEIREFEQRNLRTYALKAAEKVTNLSKELNRLSAYLQEELQYTEYRSAEEELFAKEERIESAIHLLGSLRSINDTSLSDWQGVIGEELDEKRETEMEQAEALQNLGERLSALERGSVNSTAATVADAEVDELKRQLRTLAADINGVTFKIKPRPNYLPLELPCPHCSSPVIYRQRAKENDLKAVQCKVCEASLISRYREATGFVLSLRGESKESVVCPNCSTTQAVSLDEWPTSSTNVACTSCEVPLRVSRTDNGQSVKVVVPSQQKPLEPVTPQIIESVQKALPPQPWPKGIHHTVAAQLSLKPTTVQKAIQHLIRTGVFMDQVDGVICTTAERIQLMRDAGKNL